MRRTRWTTLRGMRMRTKMKIWWRDKVGLWRKT